MSEKLYTYFKRSNKPVFMGRDVIHKRFIGYKFFGYFPTRVITRIKYSFPSGIANWWQNFMRWTIARRIELQFWTENWLNNTNLKADHSENQIGVYIFCLMYGIGVMVAIVVFFCYDLGAIKAISTYILSIVLTPEQLSDKCSEKRLQKNELHSKRYKCKLVDQFKCAFCSNFLVPSGTDIDFRLTKNLSEHNICSDAAGMSSQQISKLQILCQKKLSLLMEILNEKNLPKP